MTVGSHNFVQFTVKKPNCQKLSGCVFASGKNAMYPINLLLFVSVARGKTAFTKCVQSQVNHAKYHSQVSQ